MSDWRFLSVETSRTEITTIRAVNERGRIVAVPLTHRQVAQLCSHLAHSMERLHFRQELVAAREAAIAAVAGADNG